MMKQAPEFSLSGSQWVSYVLDGYIVLWPVEAKSVLATIGSVCRQCRRQLDMFTCMVSEHLNAPWPLRFGYNNR